jgi:hypothetical protein
MDHSSTQSRRFDAALNIWREIDELQDPRLRWPKNKDAPHFAKIWYCFMDEVTRRDYRYRMADAVKIWSDAIGEPGSSHALWVGEADPLPHPYWLVASI